MDFLTKKLPDFHGTVYFYLYGARGRTRTGTVSLPVDFESTTSANSITPACALYYIVSGGKLQPPFAKNTRRLMTLPPLAIFRTGWYNQNIGDFADKPA